MILFCYLSHRKSINWYLMMFFFLEITETIHIYKTIFTNIAIVLFSWWFIRNSVTVDEPAKLLSINTCTLRVIFTVHECWPFWWNLKLWIVTNLQVIYFIFLQYKRTLRKLLIPDFSWFYKGGFKAGQPFTSEITDKEINW